MGDRPRWCQAKAPLTGPQPVPPIYQPEVAADAIVWAAQHYRRQWSVGGSTALAITANKIMPGLADRYLAQQGYESQQYDGAADSERPNNLYEPLPGDHGAHGDFGNRAKKKSIQLWLSQHRSWLLAGGSILLGIAAAGFCRSASRVDNKRHRRPFLPAH
jgi:hypothetical protein